jgi:rhamnosyltransferase
MTDPKAVPAAAVPCIAGVVVLYECDADIVANLSTYADDLDMLVVVDNSRARTRAVEALVASHRDATYVFNGANLGVAAALNIGADWALARGAAFLLTMDQDSGFHQVPFRTFRDCVLSLPFVADLAVAAPTFLADAPAATDCSAIDRDTVITSGNLVHLGNFARIGRFDERLFIDEVDHDYCLRARDMCLRVVELPAIRLQHRLGEPRTVSVLGKAFHWNVHGPIRHYYMVRNGLYMLSKHRQRHMRYCLVRLVRLTRTVAAALMLAPARRRRLAMVAQGVRDYFGDRMGKWQAPPDG